MGIIDILIEISNEAIDGEVFPGVVFQKYAVYDTRFH